MLSTTSDYGIGAIHALISIPLMLSASGDFGPHTGNPFWFWPFSILVLRLTKSNTKLPLFDIMVGIYACGQDALYNRYCVLR